MTCVCHHTQLYEELGRGTQAFVHVIQGHCPPSYIPSPGFKTQRVLACQGVRTGCLGTWEGRKQAFHSLVKAGEGFWSGSTLRRHAGDTGNMVDRSLSLSLGLTVRETPTWQGDPTEQGDPQELKKRQRP